MRLLKINSTIVDIDDQTAIGIDLQTYDIKEPGKTFIKISNTFTIPKTVNNSKIFGLAEDVQSTSTDIYTKSSVDYWVENEQLVKDARVRVDEISDRISLFIYDKPDIWDTLKGETWDLFSAKLFLYMVNTKGIYSVLTTPFTGTLQAFVDEFGVAAGSNGIILPAFWSNLFAQRIAGQAYSVERYMPNASPNPLYVFYLYSKYEDPSGSGNIYESYGGHFGIFVKTIFEFIEAEYGVDFGVSRVGLDGNIWEDAVAEAMYIDWKELNIIVTGSSPNFSIYFYRNYDPNLNLPYTDIREKAEKSGYDFVNAFFQIMNIIMDKVDISGDTVWRLSRFDDIETAAEVVDYSGKISGAPTFRPAIEGYAQNNHIRFKTIFETGHPDANAKILASLNMNLDYETTLFEIGAHVPGVDANSPDSLLDLSRKEAFQDFTFLVSDGVTSIDCYLLWFKTGVITNATALKNLPLAQIYDLDSEYNFLESIIEYPKYYEAKMWLTIEDIRDFQFFKQYFIRELNGSFFINKIKGFNPDKSNEPTTVELIRISDKTPDTLI